MGLTHVAVKIFSPDSEDTFTGEFLVDTGAWHSLVPASELSKIGIKSTGKRAYELATGEIAEYQTGLARFSFMNEEVMAPVIFGPEGVEPLLGVTALEMAGFMVDTVNQTIKKLTVFPLKRVA